ncbi:MAG: propanediol utilization protein [Neomegalonema sp.]|nr:propanediol utilization protein [Neomegalonema sp.]
MIGRSSGHFGEILQGRMGAAGPVALTTLPCGALRTQAVFWPVAGAPLLSGGKAALASLARAAAAKALRLTGRAGVGGRLYVRSDAAAGGGCGASTMAALAAIRAVSGGRLSSAAEARLCLAVEGASDPLMFDDPGAMIWASREGRALQQLPSPPEFHVLGVLDGPGRPTDPTDSKFADISDLIAPLAAAFAAADHVAVGEIAIESALRNRLNQHLPRFDHVRAIGRRAGAAGLAAAHTGSALALLFTPAADGIEPARRELQALGWPAPILFSTTSRQRRRFQAGAAAERGR